MTTKNAKTKRVCITLTEQDYQYLSHLALETGRTVPGLIRWLLHRHFRKLDGESKK